LRDGLVEVPLVEGATLVSARSPAGPVALKLRDETHSVLLGRKGPFSLTLEFVTPVLQQPGRALATLPRPLALATGLKIDIPRPEADVRLEGGLLTARQALDGRTTIEAILQPEGAARLSWTVREAARPTTTREARWLSHVHTLATISEGDMRLAVLLDITTLVGEPAAFAVTLPEGFEVNGASGASLQASDTENGRLLLRLADTSRRRHQFLVTLERAVDGGWNQVQVPLLSVEGAQRETGEVAVEGIGTLELETHEQGTLKRMDVREAGAPLRSLAQQPLLAAFRYHRRAAEPPRLTLDTRRFPDANVPAAVADQAVATTLLTTEGRTLTEVALTVRNHAQPYLRVALPEGASLLTAEVAGETVKPVLGNDGTRVPLLRAGFRPSAPYNVSFTYLHPGTALEKKGKTRLTLAPIDIPVAMLRWEVFIPDTLKVKVKGGTALPTWIVGNWWPDDGAREGLITPEQIESLSIMNRNPMELVRILPGVVAPGESRDQRPPSPPRREAAVSASSNVFHLQERAAGILPVRVNVPRTGTSRRFLRPLVLDEETDILLRYKRRRR